MQVKKLERLSIAAAAVALVMIASCTGADESRDSTGEAKVAVGSGEVAEPATPAAAGKEVTTASGLKYEVLTTGSGGSPGPTDRVTVHYRGTLTDGTEFDSSYKPALRRRFLSTG